MTDDDVRAAIARDRTLVKTWTVRGTLHLVPARDLSLYVAAYGAIRRERVVQWLGRAGLTRRELERLSADIVEALAAGPLTRRQIGTRVGAAHGPTARRLLEHSWGGVFHHAVQEGLVCFGPTEGAQTTFVRVDQWLGTTLPVTECAPAEAELARRFLLAYGPATARDFAYWAGLYAGDARRMWERIEGERREITIDGRSAWVHASTRLPRPGGKGASRNGTPHVRLLPHFDAFLLGHRDKVAYIESARYKRVFKNAGWISPVVLVDGRVVATWSAERVGDRLVARIAAFRTLDPAVRRNVAAEAAALGAFVGAEARVRYGAPAKKRAKLPWTGP